MYGVCVMQHDPHAKLKFLGSVSFFGLRIRSEIPFVETLNVLKTVGPSPQSIGPSNNETIQGR